jgi:hypothetical protein
MRNRFQTLADDTLKTELTFAKMVTETNHFFEPFKTAQIAFWICDTALVTSSAPTTPIKIAWRPDLYLPEPGMTPLMHCLALTPRLLMAVTQSQLPMRFGISKAPTDTILGFNYQVSLQFSFFENIRQLIAPRELAHHLMQRCSYTITKVTDHQTKFSRKPDTIIHKPISRS